MAEGSPQGWRRASWSPKRDGHMRQLSGRIMILVSRWNHKIPIGGPWSAGPNRHCGAGGNSTKIQKWEVVGWCPLASCMNLVSREHGLYCWGAGLCQLIRKKLCAAWMLVSGRVEGGADPRVVSHNNNYWCKTLTTTENSLTGNIVWRTRTIKPRSL